MEHKKIEDVIVSEEEIVHEILEKNEIFQKLGIDNYYYVSIFQRSDEAISIVNAYGRWKEPDFSKLTTPFELPRKDNDFICPPNLFLLKIVSFEPHASPPQNGEEMMGDYSLWLLIDPKNKEILDARYEVTPRIFH